jgi:hypothetical protein
MRWLGTCNVSIAYGAVMQAAGTKWLTDYSGGQVGGCLTRRVSRAAAVKCRYIKEAEPWNNAARLLKQ